MNPRVGNRKLSLEVALLLLSISDGSGHTLQFRDELQATNDGEVSLECLGDRPSRCVVGLY